MTQELQFVGSERRGFAARLADEFEQAAAAIEDTRHAAVCLARERDALRAENASLNAALQAMGRHLADENDRLRRALRAAKADAAQRRAPAELARRRLGAWVARAAASNEAQAFAGEVPAIARELEQSNTALSAANGLLEARTRELTEANAALAQGEAKLRELLATLDVGAFMARDLDGTIRHWSAGCRALYGWTAEEAVGRNAHLLLRTVFPVPPAEIAGTLDRVGEWTGDLRHRHRDGRELVVTAHKVLRRGPEGRPAMVLEALTDATARYAAEQASRESETRLRLALDAGRMGIWDWDLGTDQLTWNARQFELFDLDPAKGAPGLSAAMARVHPEDRPRLEAAIAAARRAGNGTFDCEFRVVPPAGGGTRWIGGHAYALPGPDGRAIRMVGLNADVTAHRMAVEALRASEARLRSILETMPSAMLVIDEHGIIQSFSATAEQMFGWPAAEAVGRSVAMLMPSPDRERHDGYLARYLATGERRAIGIARVATGQRRDGSTFPMEITVGEVCVNGRRLFTGFAHDLTERLESQRRLHDMQAELLHVSRLNAAGEMASALAHELNQPLTAIATSVRAAHRMLQASAAGASPGGPPEGGPAAVPARAIEAMERAAGQALRAGQIVRRLRDFVAKGETDRRLENLPRLIEEAASLALAGTQQHGVQVTFRLDPTLPPVLVDRVQIQQVLVNLLRNAVESMTASATTTGAPPRRALLVAAAPAGREEIEIAVADTGTGLSPAIADRLFEAFVSGKPGGMGVGLSICRRIVEAHRGRLWAEPNPGGGTVFRFTLPAAPTRPDGEAEAR